MKTPAFLCVVVLLCVPILTVAQDVRYNFDKSADFSKYHSYKWVELKGAQNVNGLVQKQIMAELDSQLSAKGLTRTDSDDADLYIGYQAAVNQQEQFTSYSSGWGYGPGWYGGGWYGGGPTMTTGQTSTLYVGQLAVDMYDSKAHDIVWRSVVSKTLDPKAKPDKQTKNLDKAIAKMLKNYPPAKK